MLETRIAASAELPEPFRRELRLFLDTAFDGDFSDDDWAHSLGGHHVWINGDTGLIAHASVVPRQFICDGKPMHAGYVEAVATVASHRRQGYGAAVMKRIGALIHAEYTIGALSTSEHAFYESVGWERWIGPTLAQPPSGPPERTADDDDGIMILRTPNTGALRLDAPLIADWRTADVW